MLNNFLGFELEIVSINELMSHKIIAIEFFTILLKHIFLIFNFILDKIN